MFGLVFNSSVAEGRPLTKITGSLHLSSCSSSRFSKMVLWGSGPERITSKCLLAGSLAAVNLDRGPRYFTGIEGGRLGWDSSPARVFPFSTSGTQHSVK